MSNLELDYAHKFSELRQIKEEMRKKDAEIENLKALWYADADPEETAYAEDYYSRVDERDHAAIARAALDEKERMKSEIKRLSDALFDCEEHRIGEEGTQAEIDAYRAAFGAKVY